MKRSSVVSSVTAMLALGGCRLVDGTTSRGTAPPPRRTSRWPYRPAHRARSPRVMAATQQRAARRSGRQLQADARGDRHRQRRDRRAALILVKTIVSFPPTSVHGDTAVWGPHSEPLDKNAWRLTVTRVEPHVFSWALDGKPKAADDTAFVTILSGTHTRAVRQTRPSNREYGSGTFVVDWDAAQTLPDHDNAVGVATFTYSRTSPAAVTTIDVDFKGIKDNPPSTELYNALYRYTATPGAGGELKYAAKRDYSPIRTRRARPWREAADPQPLAGDGHRPHGFHELTGGDVATAPGITAPVTVSQCWDVSFLSTYRNVSYNPSLNWGDEASCSFATAVFLSPSL